MAHRDSHTVEFIVNTADYFAALTDNNEIRFGLVGVSSFQIPRSHAAANRVLACKTDDDVEAIFDDFMSGDYGAYIYNTAA